MKPQLNVAVALVISLLCIQHSFCGQYHLLWYIWYLTFQLSPLVFLVYLLIIRCLPAWISFKLFNFPLSHRLNPNEPSYILFFSSAPCFLPTDEPSDTGPNKWKCRCSSLQGNQIYSPANCSKSCDCHSGITMIFHWLNEHKLFEPLSPSMIFYLLQLNI